MKNILLFTFMIIGTISFAQEIVIEKVLDDTEIECDLIKFDPQEEIIKFIGNVSFKSNILEFSEAEEVFYYQKKKQIIVYGLKEFIIDGKIVAKKESDKKILKYTLGERVAFIE